MLRLLAQTLESGLTASSFVHSGGGVDLPASAAARLAADAGAGLPLSQTLEGLGIVDGPSAGLLRAKESHGGLPSGLVTIADRLADRRRARQRLLGLLLYPYGLLVAAALIVPAPRLFSCTPSAYFSAMRPALVAILSVPALLLGVLPRIDPGGRLRRGALRLGSNVPFVGSAVRNGALAAYADVLGAAIKAGLPVREALPLAAQAASSDPAFDRAAAVTVEQLDGGATLAAALGATGAFPASFLSQVGSGEATGKLDEVLEHLRKDHEERSRLGWLGLAIATGAVFAIGVMGLLAYEIVSGFKQALDGMKNQIDIVAPP
ncbi:MAG: type II secretion system F family protein [Deltaproteobacteria bacterium]|nr:type II secretion system F family protein [Deltaproteobacteria bacterium]